MPSVDSKNPLGQRFKQRLMLSLLPPPVYWLTRLFFLSFRMQARGYERIQADIRSGRPFIAALWHSRTIMLPRFYHWVAYRPITVIVSQSFDGQLAGAFLQRYGFIPLWGSSTRGGAEALEQWIESGRKGFGMAITADGPRGPAEVLKIGAVVAAAATGAPIYPVTYHTEKCVRLRSWDRMVIPYPFSRAIFIVGNAIRVPADADAALLESKRQEVENELNRITREAENYFSADRATS